MSIWKNSWLLVAALPVMVAALAACGGGESTSTAALSPCDAFQGLKRYRYSLEFEINLGSLPDASIGAQASPPATPSSGASSVRYSAEGSFVAPDRFQAFENLGGATASTVIIGSRTWISELGRWVESDEAAINYPPLTVCRAIMLPLDLSVAQARPEVTEGLSVLHYGFSQVPAGQALGAIYGEHSDPARFVGQADVDVWLAEKGGWPLRLGLSGEGPYEDGRLLRVTLQLTLKDVNSSSIKIEPPE